MNKIKEIIIGTNNEGKYKEIYDLLPNKVKKHSPKEFGILTPETLIPDYKLKMNVLSLQHHWSPVITELVNKEDLVIDLLFLKWQDLDHSSWLLSVDHPSFYLAELFVVKSAGPYPPPPGVAIIIASPDETLRLELPSRLFN